MPKKQSTADTIIELCSKQGVSIFLDGSKDSDSAKIGTPYTYQKKGKVLVILLVNLKSTTKEKLIPFLKEKWEEFGIALKVSQQETLESYLTYKENNTDHDTITFFTDKIPSADLDALKMSLFLRNEKELGYDISLFKQQIRERFGERGAYISNLCNSGYFENDFRFYNLSSDKFDRFYELSVGRELIAIFVHAGMTANTFRNLFEDKLTLSRRFQLNSFKIHGFGSWNVDFINRLLSEYQNDNDNPVGKEFTINKLAEEQQPPSIIYDIILIPFQQG